MNLRSALYLFLFSFIIFSCHKSDIDPYGNPSNNSSSVSTNEILIQVTDQSGTAISNASVDLEGSMATTDANGVVQFDGLNIPSKDAVITIVASGYFKGNYVMHASSGESKSIRIALTTLPTAETIDGENGGDVTISGGGKISFDKKSFLDLSGEDYTGTVYVYAKTCLPENDDNLMPNSFKGYDLDQEEVFVENHGAILVELKDASGNTLKLNEKKPAELTIPTSASDNTDLPNKLGMYYFHEGYGAWIEDGQAKLDGNSYVGKVRHFTFWMCPYVYDHHFLTGQITCSGSNLAGTTVNIYNQWGAYLGSDITNSAGGFSGHIPETLTHTLEVEDPCGNVIYSAQIGPFSSNTNLGAIDVCTGGNANYGIVNGALLDCNNDPEDLAYLQIQSDGFITYLPAVPSGLFNQAIVFCNGATEAQIMGVNQNDLTTSSQITLPISANMDFGNLQVCNTPTEYCAYNHDGTDFYYVPNQNTIFQEHFDPNNVLSNELNVSIWPLTKFSVTSFNPTVGSHVVGGSNFTYSFETTGNDGNTDITINFTSIDTTLGSIIEGTVDNVTYLDQSSDSHTLSNCSFRFIVD